MTPNMELNLSARQWIMENKKDLHVRKDLLILAAESHVFSITKQNHTHKYYRWSWNIHIHGKIRNQLKDVLLVQIGGWENDQPTDVGLYLIPYDVAVKRKSISCYEPIDGKRKRTRRNWIASFKV